MDESTILDILSGHRRGLAASLIRGLATVGTPFYAAAAGMRNALYDSGLSTVHQVDAPVISVGNLTTGGTGKTPVVAWIAEFLKSRGHRPGIVSRGYRTLDGEENDEKRLLSHLLPDVPHHQSKDRVAAARSVIAEGCNVCVLDDGFQHRRLHRDVNILVIDSLTPWGYNYLLPRGLLRESMRSLRRADAILLTRCDLVQGDVCQAIRTKIAQYTDAPVWETEFQPHRLVNLTNQSTSLRQLHANRIFAFCGIGNPGGFRRTLAGIGAPVRDQAFYAFPDHHHYQSSDAGRLAHLAEQVHAELFVTTQKDLVKLHELKLPLPVWAVEIGLVFRANETQFGDTLTKITQ